MVGTYSPDSLRNLFQSSFNLAQWYSFLQYFFNASELKERPERLNKIHMRRVSIWEALIQQTVTA